MDEDRQRLADQEEEEEDLFVFNDTIDFDASSMTINRIIGCFVCVIIIHCITHYTSFIPLHMTH